MSTQFKLTVKTPYSGNIRSMSNFGLNYQNIPGVGLVATKIFDSEDEAKLYLCKRAEMYADTEEELNEYYEQIETRGCLTLDAAFGNIDEVEA